MNYNGVLTIYMMIISNVNIVNKVHVLTVINGAYI